MLYDDDFVMSLPQNPIDALTKIIDVLLNKGARTTEDSYEARDLAVTLMKFYDYPSPPDVSLETLDNDQTIAQHLARLRAHITSQKMQDQSEDQKHKFAPLLGATFYYEFSNADVQRIQMLLNELREMVVINPQFSNDHRRRILERLEKLQRELHKRLSTVDLFWGLMGDAGVALGRFGKDAKPFVDRIREILQIVWRAQAGAEQLPASARPGTVRGRTGGYVIRLTLLSPSSVLFHKPSYATFGM